MNRGFIPIIIILVGIMLVYFVIGGFKASQQYIVDKNSGQSGDEIPCGLSIAMPRSNEIITSPLRVEGYVNGCGWEINGNIGGYMFLTDQNDRALSSPVSMQIVNKDYNYFAGVILFSNFPTLTKGKIIFQNINTNGNSPLIYELPIRFR